MVEMINSLFMTVVFVSFHNIKKRLGNKKGYFSLIVLWLGFEWLHYNWELSHPWSTLGNTFANYTQLIQWYEYTGVLGGTLWILLINILLFNLFRKILILGESFKNNSKVIITTFCILFIPIIFSVITYTNYSEKINPIEVVVVQPNIDPYMDKFNRMTEEEQVDRIISLAREKITPNTRFVVAPETAIPHGSIENELEYNNCIIEIRKLIKEYPKINFVTGISSRINYQQGGEKPTLTARQSRRTKMWYDRFNSALLIDSSPTIQIYHKSKLVLGVEKLPYPKFFSYFEKFALDLGGTVGSLGAEKEAKNFNSNSISIAPVICYESIFAEYFSSYVKKGANVAFVITNDGWWEDTPGYKQHLAYARLRAIETRRSIARSANTGTSCFINQRGDISQATNWWEQDAINTSINSNDEITFYTSNGDIIGRVAAAIAVLLLLWSWSIKIKGKFIS
jgi:apolipoprotein N-acyltransferase